MNKAVTTSELFQKLAPTAHRRSTTADMIFRQLRLGRTELSGMKGQTHTGRAKTVNR